MTEFAKAGPGSRILTREHPDNPIPPSFHLYNRQCHASTGFCWCANLLTGERIPSTSQRGLVDCSAYAYTGVANDSSADAAEAKRDLGNGDVSIDTGEKHEAEKETVDDDAEDAASLPHIKDESETASRAAVDGSSKDVDVDSAEADAAAGERVADAVPAGSSYSFMIPILVIGALLACGLKKSKLGYSQISQ